MAAITKIELWKDTGFIDGAVEIPAVYSADPVNPDMVLEPDLPISPSKDRFFSEIKVKGYFIELMEMSYLKVTYEFNEPGGTSLPKEFYGWVSDVTISSDGELPMTVISWHIDEWRTWKKNVTFGSGHVKRRPFRDLDSTPIQNYQYRYLEADPASLIELCPRHTANIGGVIGSGKIWWVIFSYNKTNSNDNNTTTIEYGAAPLFIADSGNAVTYDVTFSVNNVSKTTMNLNNILGGLFDDWFKIPPSSINGIWLSPILYPPSILSGNGTMGDPLVISSPNVSMVQPGGQYGYLDIRGRYPLKNSFTLQDNKVSSEEEHWIVVDNDGSKALDLPYGMSFSGYDVELVIEADSAFLIITFKDDLLGRTEGMTSILPLPQLPVNTNALSEYVYSGQREYDREARTVQSNAGAWKSAASGGSTGALFGAVGPIGALAGGAAGAVPGLVNYGVEMLYQNDAEQALTDRLKANQVPSLMMGSTSMMTALLKKGPSLMKLKPDSYSLGQISNTRSQFGVSVDELLPSTDGLLKATSPKGYYNIQNLIITGDIPVSAKKWIRNKFASGVRLI